jgi:hypothetical protein
MKNKKLSLENLKVTSFVTSLTGSNSVTLKGGADAAVTPDCGPSFRVCPTVPIENCNIPSYDPCPTIPIEQCEVASIERCTPMLTAIVRGTIVCTP